MNARIRRHPRGKFTTTLPASLRYQLEQAAKELRVPKSRIVCEAVTYWLSKEYPEIRFTEDFMRDAETGDPQVLSAPEGKLRCMPFD